MKRFLSPFGKLGTSIGLLLTFATLSMVILVTLNGKPPLFVAVATSTTEAPIFSVSQTPTAYAIATATPLPTTTPIPPDVTVDWIPTPIQVEDLPTPLPGRGHITGRAMCGSVPWKIRPVYLIWIENDTYSILLGIDTDEEGRWFFDNLPPRTYAILGEHPKSMPREVFVVTADKINDLGDLRLPLSVCE
jgi:hypothetical protein